MICLVVLTGAYAFLVPGIVTKMFSAKAVVGASVVLDIEKSTLGLISLLFGQGMWVPALIILLYSVMMPFAKLFALVLHLWPGNWISVRVVQKISKWATVDVFTAATICGFFCQPHMYLEINLHDGFYYFLSYCVLSVAGALLMETPSVQPMVETSTTVFSPVITLVTVLVVFAALTALLMLPIMQVQFGTVGLDASISIIALVTSLWARFPAAAISLAVLLVVLPTFDALFVVLDLLGRATPQMRQPRRWLKDFAMLDVFALSCVVVLTAVTALNNEMHLRLLPTGWIFCSLTVPWVAYSWTANAI